MARIRTIKPEFPQSESVGRLSRDARLLFIQLWTICDDHGRAKAAPRLLASLLYPYDDDAVKLMPKWLDELEQKGFIRLYEADDNKYLDIPTWSKHQRIDNAGKSHIPEYSTQDDVTQESSPRSAANHGEPPLDLGPRTIGPRTNTVGPEFERFWKSYPKRGASNPRKPASEKFARAVDRGVDPQIIITGAVIYAGECERLKIINTEKVAQAVTWLNQERWNDYAQQEKSPEEQAVIDLDMAKRGYQWRDGKWAKVMEEARAIDDRTSAI